MSLPDMLADTNDLLRDSLAVALARETSLSSDQIRHMVQTYQRFLVLQADDPGLIPPRLVGLAAWVHRRDAAAWAEFCAAWPPAATLPALPAAPARIQESEPARIAYIARFGAPPHPRVWPDPRRMRLRALALGVVIAGIAVLIAVIKLAAPAVEIISLGIFVLLSSAMALASCLAPWQVYSRSHRFAPPTRWFDMPQD